MRATAQVSLLLIVFVFYFSHGRYSPFIVVVLPVHLQQRTFSTSSSTSTVSRQPSSGAQSPHFEVSGFQFMHFNVFLILDLRVAIFLDLSIIDPDD